MKMKISILGILFVLTCNILNASNEESIKTIYLVGENHFGENEDEEKFKQTIINLTTQGKIAYAMEGLERETVAEKDFTNIIKKHFGITSKVDVYGVEDPLFIIFKEALALNSNYRSNEKSGIQVDAYSQNVFNTKKNDILCPLVHRSNQKFLKDFWNSEKLIGDPIFEYLKLNKPKVVNKSFADQTEFFKSQIELWPDSDWIDFLKKISLELLPLVEKQIPVEKQPTLSFLISCLNDDFKLGSDCDVMSQSANFNKLLHLNLRDDFIIKNLEQIRSIVKTKPVVCILGHAHIKGVKEGLEKRGIIVLGKKELMSKVLKVEL